MMKQPISSGGSYAKISDKDLRQYGAVFFMKKQNLNEEFLYNTSLIAYKFICYLNKRFQKSRFYLTLAYLSKKLLKNS